MKRDLFKFIGSVPSDAGYANYYLFHEEAVVYIEERDPWKFCILCDNSGNPILEDDKKILLAWNPNYNSAYPVWEDLLEPYRTVEVEDEEYYYDDLDDLTVGMEAIELSAMLDSFDEDDMVFLDTDDSIASLYREKYGPESVVTLMGNNHAKLIAICGRNIPDEKTNEDIDDILNSINDFDSVTVNFNNHA